jgi:hypothetical protein
MASLRLLRSVSAVSAALALTVVLAPPTPAFAQDKAVAESLFNAGKTAMDAGDYKTACKNFAESQKQDPSQGTLLNLGRCNELQGKLATAWSYYKEGARMARLKGDNDRAEAGSKLATELEPKLSKLTVSAAAPTPGLVVARIRKDDNERVEIGGGVLGVAIDVDPGAYTIEASAPGYKKWTGEVTIGQTADKQSVSIPALEKAPEGAAEPVPGATEPPPGGDEGGMNGLTIAGFAVGGVGVVGLVVGAITGLSASSTASGAEDDPALCPNKQCSEAGLDEIDSAKSSATISTVGFIAGGVLLAGGATMVILGMSQGSKSDASNPRTIHIAKNVELEPVASPQGGGMWMSGSF